MNKKKHLPDPLSTIWTNPIHFIACGFGVGKIPFAPGTFGTLVGVLLYLFIADTPIWLYLSITTALILAGIYLCGKTNRDFGTDDHPAAVWDEIATFPVTLIALPNTWYYIVAAFLLFRLFDIWKPGPIGWIDKHIHGGLGVMLDDVAAALVTLGILHGIHALTTALPTH